MSSAPWISVVSAGGGAKNHLNDRFHEVPCHSQVESWAVKWLVKWWEGFLVLYEFFWGITVYYPVISYMGNIIILVVTVGGFVFFEIKFQPRNLGESMIQFDGRKRIFFWQMGGGEKTTNGKMRFGSVPYKNKQNSLQDRTVGFSKSSKQFLVCKEGRRNVQRLENFPAAKVFNMWTSKWTSSDESRGSTVTDFTIGHVVKMEVVTLTRQPCYVVVVVVVACISFSKDSQGTCFTGVVWGWFVFDFWRFCAPQVFKNS